MSQRNKSRPTTVVTINRKDTSVTRVGGKRVAVNSFSDLERLHTREHANKTTRNQALDSFVRNLGEDSLMARGELLRYLLDGPRDIDAECGYPSWLTPDHYRAMYDREGISKRVVECEPEETWSMDPEIFEDEDPETDTDFESELKTLIKDFNIFHYLQRIDVLSGIGQFGILMFGINDDKELYEPVDGMNDDGSVDEGNDYKLLYVRPFSEEVVFVKARETDVRNPRYGMPTMYTIMFRDFPNWGIQAGEIISRDVHWSRVQHVADNRKMSEVFGIPRMQQVYNRLYDLRKVYAASGEAYWKGAFQSLSFEVNPELADQGVEIDSEAMKKQMERVQSGMQRWIATTGLSTKVLPAQVVDPTMTIETHLKAIAIAKGIPYRVLFGSEEAKLAGAQDSNNWNRKLGKRQTKYVTPMIIRPFVDRMIAYGVLPKPVEYHVEWPDLGTLTDLEKAQVSLARTQAMATYVSSGMSQVIGPKEFYTMIMGMTVEEAKQVGEGAVKNANDQDAQEFDEDGNPIDMEEDGIQDDEFLDDEEEDNANEGRLGGASPDNGDALRATQLARTGVKRPVDAQISQAPIEDPADKKKKGKAPTTNFLTRVSRKRQSATTLEKTRMEQSQGARTPQGSAVNE